MERLGGGHVILNNWLRRYRAGAALCRFSPQSWNRVANVLESIEGVGCRIAKTENGWGWQIIVDGNSDYEPPPGFESGGYPFGPRWNFGIGFDGDAMRVYSGVCYHAGKKLAWAGPGTGNPATVTGLTDGAVVCVVYTLATRVLSIAVRDPAEDYGGEIVRALCSVKVANNIASLDKWYGGGFELGIKGGSV
jgi:hypothetical protein